MTRFSRSLMLLAALGAFSCAALGQTLPSGVLNAPPLVIGSDESIGTGTTLNVADGGLVGDNFEAGASNGTSVNVEVNITGGQVGANFEARGGSTINISGGSVGRDFDANRNSIVNVSGGFVSSNFNSFSDSEVNISGGGLGSRAIFFGGSTVNLTGGEIGTQSEVAGGTLNISGGVVGRRLLAGTGSVVNISGGELGDDSFAFRLATYNISGGNIGRQFWVVNTSTVNVSGGVIESDFLVSGSSTATITGGVIADGLEFSTGADVTIRGANYRLDGVPIVGLETPFASQSFTLPAGSVLTGEHADGTPFAYSSVEGDQIEGPITLETVVVPTPTAAAIVVPSDTPPAGVRNGQTLFINAGGGVPTNFAAGVGSTVEVSGGTIGTNFEATGTTVSLSSGSIGFGFDAFHGTSLTMSGGELGASAQVFGSIEVTGGRVGGSLTVRDGATARVAGGTIDDRLRLDPGAALTIVGDDLRLDGAPIAGLETIGATAPLDLAPGEVLSGTLADGTPFALSTFDGDVLLGGSIMLERAAALQVGPATLDAAMDDIGFGVRDGQTLAVGPGALVPYAYNAGRGSTIDITGGDVGNNLEAVAAEINLASGRIGDHFDAYDGSAVTVTGGEIGFAAVIDGGSTLSQTGGSVSSLSLTRGAEATIAADAIIGGIGVGTEAVANLNGGSVGSAVTNSSGIVDLNGANVSGRVEALGGGSVVVRGGAFGNGFRADPGSELMILGADFRIDGVPVAGLDQADDTLAVNVPAGALLSGTLADGTPFAIGRGFRTQDSIADGTLTLARAPDPAAGPAVLQVPTDEAPLGVRAGQTLILSDGGALPTNFNAGQESTVEIHGGTVGANFEAVGAQVFVTGGEVGGDLDLYLGSTMTVTGGVLGSGGTSASSTNVFGGVLNLHGGSIAGALIADGGEVNLFGYGFAINGTPITDLILDEVFEVLDRGGMRLTGYLDDGTPIELTLNETSGRIFDAFSLDTTLTVTLVEIDVLEGDFNADGTVDSADYTVWRDALNTSTPLPNETATLGQVTIDDYFAWRDNFGASLPAASATVPEPAGVLIAIAGVTLLSRHRGRQRN